VANIRDKSPAVKQVRPPRRVVSMRRQADDRRAQVSALDLDHGVATGQDAYAGKSLAALGWLFPA